MEKILDIIDAIAHEKNISKEHAVEAFQEALTNTAKKLTSFTSAFEVLIDHDTGVVSGHNHITQNRQCCVIAGRCDQAAGAVGWFGGLHVV